MEQTNQINQTNQNDNLPSLKIIPLGGAGMVTKNMWVYEYGQDIWVVDAGMGFPNEEMLGVDLVIPDISYLEERAARVRGIFLTHGHEDHIGALPYILTKLDVPVYGAKLTLGLARARLEEFESAKGAKMIEVDPNDELQVGGFRFTFFRLNHSVPDNLGLVIKTGAGTVVHAADYKFDWTPVDGKPTEVHKLALLRGKIDLMLSDCVRIEKPGYTLPEKAIQETFEEEMRKAQKRVIITTFSSNISRLQQAVDAARKFHRKIAFIGKSIYKNMEVAESIGYLKLPKDTIISPKDIKKYQPEDLVVLISGSQGQSNSALARVANNDHPFLQIEEGDVVIFASDPIPGNVDAVYHVIDQLSALGAEVRYSEITEDVHVSGHASKEELKFMLGLTKPRFLVPIGGEMRHAKMFADIAKEIGVERTFILDEGQTLELNRKGAHYGNHIKTSEIMIDGTGLEDVHDIVIRDRQVLAHDGMFLVIVSIDKNTKEIVGNPEVISRGFVYMKEANKIIDDTKSIVVQTIKEKGKQSSDLNYLRRELITSLEKYIYRQTEMRPMILPVVLAV